MIPAVSAPRRASAEHRAFVDVLRGALDKEPLYAKGPPRLEVERFAFTEQPDPDLVRMGLFAAPRGER